MEQWYVKIDDGTVYGPVDTETLKGWAGQGRVEPTSELSSDQENWFPAERMRELQMDWIAELPDGSAYGPFNICLLPELKQDGVLPPGTTLRNRSTNEVHVLEEALPDKERPSPTTSEEQHRANGQQDLFSSYEERPEEEDEVFPEPDSVEAQELPTEAPPVEEEPEPETETPPPAEEDNEQLFDDEDEPEPEAVIPERAPVSPAEAVSGTMLAQRIQTLQNSASLARSQLSSVRKELNEQKAYSSTLQDQLRKLEEDLSAAEAARVDAERSHVEQNDRASLLESELENANAQLEQLQEHYDRLQLEAQKQFETLDETRAQLLQQEHKHQEHLALYNERLAERKAHMIRALQTLMRDEELLDPNLPEHLLPQDDGRQQLDQLRTDLEQMQAMYRKERSQVQDLEQRMTALATRQLPPAVLAIIGALLVACGIFAGMAFRNGGSRSTPSPKPTPAPAAVQQDTQEIAPTGSPPIGDLPPDTASAEPAAAPSPAAAPTWPVINDETIVATVSNNQMRIVFNNGIFEQETQLSSTAPRNLETIAHALRPIIANFRLKVEGHTDAVPVSTRGSSYVSNYALGQARAKAVYAELVTKHRLPANRISATSAGEKDPPFPNNTEAMRRRNRTVILILVPAQD